MEDIWTREETLQKLAEIRAILDKPLPPVEEYKPQSHWSIYWPIYVFAVPFLALYALIGLSFIFNF